MGGVSQEVILLSEIDGRRCLRLTGDVRLENNGGFIQMALDLAPEGRTLDASSYTGVLMVARGNGESYGVHLRTPDCVCPWQSYRAEFLAAPEWRETLDASSYTGVLMVARGNGESYGVHLRTPDCVCPWQSYRAEFLAAPEWREIRLPFQRFESYRLTEPLDVRRLRRLGLVAVGRAFHADLAASAVGLYG